jgi:predicted glutamine amidotransferase
MCRLLLMTGIQKPDLVEPFMKEAKITMSVGNQMGIGYSAVKKDGDFFTERWHDNDKFFDRDSVRTEQIAAELSMYKKQLSSYTNIDQNYSLTGSEPTFSDVSTVTMHTRFATCGKEFENTHPFVDADHSLVHNGVINNAHSLGLNKISTCDSEAALQSYINNNVGKEIQNAQAWIDTLSGYWAFGILSRDASGVRILDVIRNDAWLYFSEVRDFGVVLATTENIITGAAKTLGLEYTKPKVIKDNKLFRFNATTGELISQTLLYDSKKNSRSSYSSGWQSNADYEKVTGKTREETKKNPLVLVTDKSMEVNPSKNESKKDDSADQLRPSDSYTNIGDFFDYLYNNDEPLLDRLHDYDQQFSTNHAYQYECLAPVYRSDSWATESFDTILDEIDEAYHYCFGEADTSQ